MITMEQQTRIMQGITNHWYGERSVWLTVPNYDIRIGWSVRGLDYTAVVGYVRTPKGLAEVARVDLPNDKLVDLLPNPQRLLDAA